MGLIDRLRAIATPVPAERTNWGDLSTFSFNGVTYPFGLNQTLTGTREEIGSDYTSFGNGTLKGNPVVFACMQARSSLFSEARFMYRHLRSGTPGELWSQPELDVLRHPWPGGTTGDLLARVIQDADLAGNSFWVRRGTRLFRLRPDWVTIIHGSYSNPMADMWDPEAELLGYAYQPNGSGTVYLYQASEVAHFAPIPDPIAPARGMSWLTPLIREIQADSQMTTHKQAYLVNGATPNLVITGVPGASPTAYQEWVDKFSAKHDGAWNAYKSLYLTAAMDAKALGSDLVQIDFKAVQGQGETRISAAAGVPAVVVGISEGLAGSSLNAGNFASSMRRFADLTMRPLWRNVCGSFEQIIRVPGESELWYDDRDIAALKDDIMDAAEVRAKNAQAIRTLVDSGFEPESVVAAINAGDLTRLTHTGLYSVQLQPPGTTTPEPAPEPAAPAPAPAAPGRSELLEYLTRRGEHEPPQAAPVISEGAIHVEVHPAPPAQVNFAEGAFRAETPVTFAEGAFQVDSPVTIERGAVEVTAPITTPEVQVINGDVTNTVDAEPIAAAIAERIEEINKPRTKRIERDAAGLIVAITEEQ